MATHREIATTEGEVLVIDAQSPRQRMRGDHVHGCPSCYERVPCNEVCSIEPDLTDSIGTPCGAYVICDRCAATGAQAAESFRWEGYCTRCGHGVSWDEDADPPETPREAVCHECDRALVREEALEEAAQLCEAHAEWAGEPGRMPPECRAGSVGASLGLAREIRALSSEKRSEVKP